MHKLLTEFQHHGDVFLQLRYTPEGGSAEQILDIKENGYLGELQPGKVQMEVLVNVDFVSLLAYTLKGKAKDNPKWKVDAKTFSEKYLTLASGQKETHKSYQLSIPIIRAEKKPFKGIPTAIFFPDNTMRFLLLKEGGRIETWMLSVISQWGKFFFTMHKAYDTACYLDNKGQIFCPEFEKPEWEEMRYRLKEWFNRYNRCKELLPLSAYKKPTKEEICGSRLPEGQARVIYYNIGEGVGHAYTWVGPKLVRAKLYWRQICKRDSGPTRLYAGEVITYKRLIESVYVRHAEGTLYYALEGMALKK